MRFLLFLVLALLAVLTPHVLHAAEDTPRDFVPQLLGAQYTFIDQHQDALHSPYASSLSLEARGDTEQSHTFGVYFGVQLPAHFQYYFDIEMFKGEGISGATGVGAVVNGDVVHSGNAGLGKRAYVARRYLQWMLPLGHASHAVERGADQLPGTVTDRHVEAKLGRMSPADDFDKNRYANSARTQYMNGAFFNSLAWDYAADTRGYTNGLLLAYVSPHWTLRYGAYQMPTHANGQALEWPISRARGEQAQLTLRASPDGWALRLLAYRNLARMGVYAEALQLAARTGSVPDIRLNDQDGRSKYGYAVNAELPLADNGDTGLFARYGWNDGHTESFAFTEVDRDASVGVQIAGTRWHRADDRLGVAIAMDALSRDHRDYLAAGGSGFLLGDRALHYRHEEIAETYYAFQWLPHVTLGPDLQFIRNPGYNHDRGPARFLGLRVHLDY